MKHADLNQDTDNFLKDADLMASIKGFSGECHGACTQAHRRQQQQGHQAHQGK